MMRSRDWQNDTKLNSRQILFFRAIPLFRLHCQLASLHGLDILLLFSFSFSSFFSCICIPFSLSSARIAVPCARILLLREILTVFSHLNPHKHWAQATSSQVGTKQFSALFALFRAVLTHPVCSVLIKGFAIFLNIGYNEIINISRRCKARCKSAEKKTPTYKIRTRTQKQKTQ